MRLSRTAFLVGVLAIAAGGVAYATIPDAGGTIRACYSPGTGPGLLRVIDTAKGQQCKTTEHALAWNQTGVAGPTSLNAGNASSVTTDTNLITHTVAAEEAGLTILTSPFQVTDLNGTTGGTTTIGCSILVNGTGAAGYFVTVSDSGSTQGTSASFTNIARMTLAAGDVVTVTCSSIAGDGGEAGAFAKLLLERVSS